MKRFKLLIVLASFLIIFGCYVSPYGVYDLRVSDENINTMWLNGKELVKLSNDTADIIVNYDTSENGILIFDLSIFNKTNETILISPEDFSCKTINRLNEANQIQAIDPEKMIKHYSKRIEFLRVKNKSENREDVVFSLFEVADTFSSKTTEEREEAYEEMRDRKRDHELRINKNNTNMSLYKEKRRSFEIDALRKTSLLPEHKIGGKIYFPMKGSLTEFLLLLPIGKTDFTIEYNIEKM